MIYTASRDYGVKRKKIALSHHHALQGISSATAHIERISVYRKSQQGFISTRVIARNKVPLRLMGFLHALRLVEMTTKKEYRHLERSLVIQSEAKNLLERLTPN